MAALRADRPSDVSPQVFEERKSALLSAAIVRARAERLPAHWSRVFGVMFVLLGGLLGLVGGVNAAQASHSWVETSGRTDAVATAPPLGVAACLGECPPPPVVCDEVRDLDCEPTALPEETFVLGAVRWFDSAGGVRHDVVPVPVGAPAGAERPLWVSGSIASPVDPLPGWGPGWLLVTVFTLVGILCGRLAGVMVGWPMGWLAGFPYRRKAARIATVVHVAPWWSHAAHVPEDLSELTDVDRMMLTHYSSAPPKRSVLMRALTTPLFGPRREAEHAVASAWKELGLRDDERSGVPDLFRTVVAPGAPSSSPFDGLFGGRQVQGPAGQSGGTYGASAGVPGSQGRVPSAFPNGVPVASNLGQPPSAGPPHHGRR